MRIADHTLNRLRLLKTIRHDGPINRSLLPARTGLSAGTVTNLTANLLKRGLVVERREEEPVRGRPRALLSIDGEGGVVVGVSQTGLRRLQIAFVDLSGALLQSGEVDFAGRGSLDDFAADLAERIRHEIAASPYPPERIRRIGIALPAIVDTRSGTVQYIVTFAPGPSPFTEIVERIVGVPVTIENDLACMARAEHWFGRAQAFEDFALVRFDLALGSARYFDGLPLVGSNGINPELGHTKIDTGPGARKCYCGAKGCATMYGSIIGVLYTLGMLGQFDPYSVDNLERAFTGVIDRAGQGEAEALAALREAARLFGLTVANHVNAADPGVVLAVLPDARMELLVGEVITETLAANVMPGMLAGTRVLFAAADPNWRWKGTAALALEREYLAPD